MDDADLDLVRALLNDPLASVADLARTAGLGDSAARARVKRLRASGVLGEVAALPNGRLLGRRYVTGLYSSGDWREMMKWPGVVGCSVNHEGVVAPTCLTPDGTFPQSMRERYGEPERTFVQTDAPLTPAGDALSGMQWRILTEVVRDPTGANRVLAERCGLGVRAVKRHREAFIRGGHLRLEISMRSMRGDHVLFHFFVQGPGSHADEVRVAISKRLGGAWPLHLLQEPRGVLFFCAAPDLAAAAAMPRFAMGLHGVEHAELVINVDGAYDTEELVAACEAAAGGK